MWKDSEVRPVVAAHGTRVDNEAQRDDASEEVDANEGAIHCRSDARRLRLVIVCAEADRGAYRRADADNAPLLCDEESFAPLRRVRLRRVPRRVP